MKVSNVIRYVFGGLFIFTGLAYLTEVFIAGVLFILFGVSLFPNIYKKLNYSDNKKVQIIAPIVLFFLAFMFVPATETEVVADLDTENITSNVVVTEEVVEVNDSVNTVNEIVENIIEENTVSENATVQNVVNEVETEEKVDQEIKEEINVIKESKVTSTETTVEQVEKEEIVTTVLETATTESSNSSEVRESYESTTVVEETPEVYTYTQEETVVNTEYVWIPQSGKKYHDNSGCSNMKNPSQVTESEAISRGYAPCKKCY